MTNGSENSRQDHAIAIVGMALKVPGAQNVDDFWGNLASGTESIERLDQEALRAAGERSELMADPNYVAATARLDKFDHFDPEFFGFSPKDAAILDPQHRKFLETCWEALEQSGRLTQRHDDNVGVFAGCGMGSYFYFNICSNPDLVDDVGMFLLRHTGNDKDFLATRVSHVLDIKGPSVNLQTACSTSLVAVHYACEALRSGTCDTALAGGSTIELPHGRGYVFKENEILSPDGHCHAFDHRAEGTVFGSGAGVVALRRLSDAIADGDPIWAVIRGSAINNDGAAKAGYLAPSVDGQAAAVSAALRNAKVSADSIGYVECHGTGTRLGDPIEVAALTEAFRETTDKTGFCGIGSVKTNIGHLDTAAGVASLIKTSLALHHKQLPPTLNFEAPNPAIDFEGSPFHVQDKIADWPIGDTPRRAGVNSLGVGGTNAHVVLEEAPERVSSEESDWPFHVLCLSAHSNAALDDSADALAAHLSSTPNVPLADVAYTLKSAKEHFPIRRVVVAEDHAEAIELLKANNPRTSFTHRSLGPDPEVVFMFPGGGAQYAGMARDLYETEPVFAEWMDRGLDHLSPQLDYDIRAIWLPEAADKEAADETLKQPSVQLPLIMIVEYALAQLWMSWGVRPKALVGHSMGENTAAALAGVISFEDCIDLVLLRGRLFDKVERGGMLSVALPLDELKPLIGDDLDIASINADGLCAVSGPQALLDKLEADLSAKEIETQRINIDIAAHSRMLDPILPEFRDFLRTTTLAAPNLPIISNLTGAPLLDEQAMDPDYWVDQLRNTVRFADCIDHLTQESARVYFEVGPGRALSSLAQMHEKIQSAQVLSALRHPQEDIADDKFMLGVVGRFWATGIDADWAQIWGDQRRNRVVLPTYPFQGRKFFIEPGEANGASQGVDLERSDDIANWGYRPSWRPVYANCDRTVLSNLGKESPMNWLFFADEQGLCDDLAAKLKEAGHGVARVYSGDSYSKLSDEEYRLAPDQGQAGYAALMEGLSEDGKMPDRIVHGWLATELETFRPGSDFFTRNLEHGMQSLVHLAQALEGASHPETVHVTVLTTGAAKVGDEKLTSPEKATISGPAGVVPKELPGVSIATLDVPTLQSSAQKRPRFVRSQDGRADESQALMNLLFEDLLSEPGNSVAALRDGRRYELDWVPTPLSELPEEQTDRIKDGGVYLITGGLGGMGLSIARDLAKRHQAHMVLLGRTALPKRESWEERLKCGCLDASTRERLEALLEIEELGGSVQVESVDVCDIVAMQDLVERTIASKGAINGVFHAAGWIDDAPLLGKTLVQMEKVLAPKVHGLRVLEEIFPDGSLDLLVLFSSTSVITRPGGQVDYVAANAFLNAYAQSRSGDKTKVVAVSWGIWAEVGMAANMIADPKEGPWVASDAPLISEMRSTSAVEWQGHAELRAEPDWIVNEHRMSDGAAVLPGTGFIEFAAQSWRASGGTFPVAIENLIFLRALDVADGTALDLRASLVKQGGRSEFQLRSHVDVDGRDGLVLHSQADLRDASKMTAPERIDVSRIRARCARPSRYKTKDGFQSPQETHLKFGPRWNVVRDANVGEFEGIAQLQLAEAYQGDIDQGYVVHPALLDLGTGWAMELIEGYTKDRLWVPVSYERIVIHGPLSANLLSWVRLREETNAADGIANFDVTLVSEDGTILVEVTNFQMQRLDTKQVLGASKITTADNVVFEDQNEQQTTSPGEAQIRRMVSMGIRPDEGNEALKRALAGSFSEIALSPIDLDALVTQSEAKPQGQKEGQSFERPELDEAYEAPSTEMETALAALWEKLLGVSRVGVNDSFFDLGGHSLLAVRMFAAVKRDFGVNLPISALLEAPTVALCSDMIEARSGAVKAATTSSEAEEQPEEQMCDCFKFAVKLAGSKDSTKAPLFIVAGMFGNVLNLRHLAMQLDERPVYGLQARGLTGEELPHDVIEEAAADYVKEILQIVPNGPYLIGGFSGGGITAYEIAQQLKAQGKEVTSLLMLDTPLPVRTPLKTADKILMKLHEFRRKGPKYLVEWASERWAWELQKRVQARKDADLRVGHDGSFNNRQIELAFRRAIRSYQLKSWDGPLTVFRPALDYYWKVTGGNWLSREREYVFKDNGWRQWAKNLDVVEVPGDHNTMVLMPNVNALAGHIRELLEAPSGAQEISNNAPKKTAAE